MIYYFSNKRAFNRRIKSDRRTAEIFWHENKKSLGRDRRMRNRRVRLDRRSYNKGFHYRWALIRRLFD